MCKTTLLLKHEISESPTCKLNTKPTHTELQPWRRSRCFCASFYWVLLQGRKNAPHCFPMCSSQKTQQALIKGIWLQRLGKLGADAHPSFLISFSAWKQTHVFSMLNCSSDSEGEKRQRGHICPSERDHVCVHCSCFSPESIRNRFLCITDVCVSIYSWGLLSLFQFEERCLKAAATRLFSSFTSSSEEVRTSEGIESLFDW